MFFTPIRAPGWSSAMTIRIWCKRSLLAFGVAFIVDVGMGGPRFLLDFLPKGYAPTRCMHSVNRPKLRGWPLPCYPPFRVPRRGERAGWLRPWTRRLLYGGPGGV